jgi:hypothetical protein
VNLLSSTEPAQSASEKAQTNIELDFRIMRPIFVFCLKYHKIRFIAAQCISVGA